jgi:hypothetical protein
VKKTCSHGVAFRSRCSALSSCSMWYVRAPSSPEASSPPRGTDRSASTMSPRSPYPSKTASYVMYACMSRGSPLAYIGRAMRRGARFPAESAALEAPAPPGGRGVPWGAEHRADEIHDERVHRHGPRDAEEDLARRARVRRGRRGGRSGGRHLARTRPRPERRDLREDDDDGRASRVSRRFCWTPKETVEDAQKRCS